MKKINEMSLNELQELKLNMSLQESKIIVDNKITLGRYINQLIQEKYNEKYKDNINDNKLENQRLEEINELKNKINYLDLKIENGNYRSIIQLIKLKDKLKELEV